MVRVIQSEKYYPCEEVLGTFIDQKHYDLMIDEDCDFYAPSIDGSMNEDNIVFKLRKGAFSAEEQALAYSGLRRATAASQNRGLAAGPRGEMLREREWVTASQMAIIDFLSLPPNSFDDGTTLESVIESSKSLTEDETRGFVWLRGRIEPDRGTYEGWFDRWIAGLHNMSKKERYNEAMKVRNYISDTNYAAPVMSGIAGYFGRYPRIPYGRATAYTEHHPDDFAKCYPFLAKLEAVFAKELPEKYRNQRTVANSVDPRFTINGSCFTTLTVNHNWRTAAHRDAGDLHTGFSNISALTGPDGKGWQGGEFILPEYRVAIHLEPRDLLLVNNHGGIHGNAPLIGDNNDRLTIVSYFREDIMDLKSMEYEALRRQFVDERRKNPKHPLQRPLWNGVSASMWASQEWADYLIAHGMADEDGVVSTKQSTSLEDFFG